MSAADRRLAVGLMSGTSVDAVDAALVEVRLGGPAPALTLLERLAYPIPEAVRSAVFELFEDRAGSLHRLALLNQRLGELFAEAALALLERAGRRPGRIAVIGSHGQTVHHVSQREPCCGMSLLGSLQIGEGAVIAQRTGIPVASDFRAADIAAGGTGAPLVPLLDKALFGGERRVVVQNIGGIGNLTWLEGPGRPVLAFDTGPGNMVVDLLVSRLSGGRLGFDRDGEIGRTGRVLEELLAGWMRHPFFSRPLPKTAGREEFGTVFLRDYVGDRPPSVDLVRTAEELTARSIAEAYRRHLRPAPRKVIVTGGGARNPIIMEALGRRLPPGVQLLTGEQAGIDSDFKEAIAFALLGLLCLLRRPGNLPEATGARAPAVLGKLSFPCPGRAD